jgi:hypothetical protein
VLIIILSIPSHALDFDEDGIPDEWERKNGLKVDIQDADKDADNDGLTNIEEYQYNTDPQSADSDGDGINDKEEIEKGTNPLDPNDPPKVNSSLIIVFSAIMLLLLSGLAAYFVNKSLLKRRSNQPKKIIQKPYEYHIEEKPFDKPKKEHSVSPAILPEAQPKTAFAKNKLVRTEDQKKKIRQFIFNEFTPSPDELQKKKEAEKEKTQKEQQQKSPESKKEGKNEKVPDEKDALRKLSAIISKKAGKMPEEGKKETKSPIDDLRKIAREK